MNKSISQRFDEQFRITGITYIEGRKVHNIAAEQIKSFFDSEIKEIMKEVEGLKIEPTKHERCTLDEDWCYNHSEIMEDEDRPNGAYHRNKAIDSVLEILRSKL